MKAFLSRFFIILVTLLVALVTEARRGCCSHHGGVNYCDSSVGRLVCHDGTYSPSCGCEIDKPKPKKNQRATQVPTTEAPSTEASDTTPELEAKVSQKPKEKMTERERLNKRPSGLSLIKGEIKALTQKIQSCEDRIATLEVDIKFLKTPIQPEIVTSVPGADIKESSVDSNSAGESQPSRTAMEFTAARRFESKVELETCDD